MMDMGFLNKKLEARMEIQRQLTLKSGGRTRNMFYRRCAVVGFRAGMLAHFLYNEANNNAQRHEVEGGMLCTLFLKETAHFCNYYIPNSHILLKVSFRIMRFFLLFHPVCYHF